MSEGNRDTHQEFLQNTLPFQALIRPLRGDSTSVSREFRERIDLLFVDGDHSYEGVKADVDAWFPHLAPNATVVFHDYGWAEGVKQVIQEGVLPQVMSHDELPNLWWGKIKFRS